MSGNATKSFDRKLYERKVVMRIRAHLAANSIEVRWLAKAAGIPENTLYGYISGKRPFSMYAIAMVCMACGLDANKVLGIRRQTCKR